ncbi:hypothetical protein ABL78_2844 [Leptomonas seymouri]|uniref:Uncharacterized protein n=1 Tax=Leptomonas seymouri TaxID=5684 RepID=A0A0N1ILD5_LEPSE|nr:hypothetical protein ABL78_2844 [Leptomonas seymouri]|eukprot:KPI88068.1 hypothetical protein ABL78_2844 [Leptomonas seymouri]
MPVQVLGLASPERILAGEGGVVLQEPDPSTQCHHKKAHKPSAEDKRRRNSREHRSRGRRAGSKVPKQLTPPPPSQFVIEKQGRFEEERWYTRVITLDVANHRLYLSKANNAEELLYRCMVGIDVVQLWPTFDKASVSESFDSDEAKRTVRIKGLVGVKPSTSGLFTRLLDPKTSAFRRLFGGKGGRNAARELAVMQAETAKHGDPQLKPAAGDWCEHASDSADISNFGQYTHEVWLIRAMTIEDLQLLARALRRAVPDKHHVSGFHRALGLTKSPAADAYHRL